MIKVMFSKAWSNVEDSEPRCADEELVVVEAGLDHYVSTEKNHQDIFYCSKPIPTGS